MMMDTSDSPLCSDRGYWFPERNRRGWEVEGLGSWGWGLRQDSEGIG